MRLLLFAALFSFSPLFAQLTPTDLLEKSIQYHDPNNQWEQFQATFQLTEADTSRNKRERRIMLDNPQQSFYYWESRKGNIVEHFLMNDTCRFRLNGKKDFIPEQIKKYRFTCERTKDMRDYYAYIYGLPMKLKDPGTILGEEVSKTIFNRKKVYGLRVTYSAEVGNDIWYFYFDRKNYSLVGYRFYHDEAKNDGEYIHLEEEAVIGGIKMPRIRTWYTHSDDRLLGTDILLRQ